MPAKKATKYKVVRNKKNHPSWEGWEKWTPKVYSRMIKDTREYYYINFKHADLLPNVWAWMKDNGYTQTQIKQAKLATGLYSVSHSISVFTTMLYHGMPDYNQEYAEYWESLPGTMGTIRPFSESIKEKLDEAILSGSTVVEEIQQETPQDSARKPTIQDRLHEQSLQMCADIDEWLDTFDVDPKKFNAKEFDFKTHFKSMKTTQVHARKIIKFYQPELDEWRAVSKQPSAAEKNKMQEAELDELEQIKEGYGHIKKAEFDKIITALELLIQECEFVIDSSKATRKTRAPKAKPVARVVEKLKYKKTDEKYKIASVDPVNIVGATTLWVFNTKTRKLGKYVAANIDPTGANRPGSGLSVKGTSITGFSEAESIQKTLRKPDETLKEFKAAGKVKLRKFIEEINTTDTKLNGRINPDTVLLKVS